MSQSRALPDDREALIQWIRARVDAPSFLARLANSSVEDLQAIRAEIERNSRRFAATGRLAALAEDDDEAFAVPEDKPHAAA